MRELGPQEIDDIAVGAAILGSGGGGDPHIGKLMVLQAIEEHGPVQLVTPDELPDLTNINPFGRLNREIVRGYIAKGPDV